jgi:oligopeptide/dipeptide ABC transporter ATP-binding protein
MPGSSPGGVIRAVDGVDLEIGRGEIVALVGESGSGKTTLGRCAVGLLRPTAGEVRFGGQRLAGMTQRGLASLRRRLQFVSQDPHASLSPRMRVSRLMAEPYAIHRVPRPDRTPPEALLDQVGLSEDAASRYPHQLSGGQARRVGIARALALEPDLIVADEPTAGLDVSAAASVLNLLLDLRGRRGLAYLVITHDLHVAGFIADRIAVMYLGQLVELGPAEPTLDAPAHPYTQALLAAVGDVDPARRAERPRLLVRGEIPSPRNPPPGCRFHTRCPHARDRCSVEAPPLQSAGDGRLVSCHFWKEIRDAAPPGVRHAG